MPANPPRPPIQATPYTPFAAPPVPTVTPRDPGTFSWSAPSGLSEAGQFRLDTGNKAIQRSAAAKGTLLNPGTAMALARFSQGLASEEAEKDFERGLATFNANTAATLGYNPQDAAAQFGTYDRGYGAARDIYGDQQAAAHEATSVENANAMADYAAQLAKQRAETGGLGGGTSMSAVASPYSGWTSAVGSLAMDAPSAGSAPGAYDVARDPMAQGWLRPARPSPWAMTRRGR